FAIDALDKQEKNTRPEAEQHDGDAGGDAPKGSDGGTTIIAAADDDVTGHGHEQFEDAAAQQPLRATFHQRFRVVVFGTPIKHHAPKTPEDGGHADCTKPESPAKHVVSMYRGFFFVLSESVFYHLKFVIRIHQEDALIFEQHAKD